MRQKESKEGSKGGLEEKYNQIIIQKINTQEKENAPKASKEKCKAKNKVDQW